MSVIVEQQGAVLIVTLNKPAQHNALDGETMSGVGAALADAESDDRVAVVVLTGAGDRSFCAGMDLKAFAARGITPGAADGPGLGVLIGGTHSKPVIAAVNGSSLAGGFELLLACDLIVAAEHAKFGILEVKRGLVTADGVIRTVPQRIPLVIVLEFGPTGELIDAHQAQQLGLVGTVVPAGSVLAEATRLAQLIAATASLAVRFRKDQVYAGARGVDDTARRGFQESVTTIFLGRAAPERARAFAVRGTRLDGTVKCRSTRWTTTSTRKQSACARVEAIDSRIWIGRSARTATSARAAGGCKRG
jgi:enoyl-CoA hydratase